MAAREALYIVVESAFGTPKNSPVLNTDAYYMNLPESDALSGIMTPVFQETPYGGGLDVPFDVVADHYTTALNWKGYVYPSIDAFLLNFACQRINAGQTSPWTTTEPAGDLASAAFYKQYAPRVSTAVKKVYIGCKCQTLQLDSSRDDPKLKFSATLVAKEEQGNAIDSSSDPTSLFTLPTDVQLPVGPFLHSHSATNLSVAGSPVTNYQSVSIKVANKLDVLFFENHFPSVIGWTGRTIEITFQRLLGTTPNYRTTFQGLTSQATYVKYYNGVNSFKIDLGARAHVSAYSQQLGLGKEFLETVTLKAKLDTSTGTDCTLTFT